VKTKPYIILTLTAALALTGCATTTEPAETAKTAEQTVKMNDFPTRDRVEYVFNCIAQHGGKLTYITQYACGCKIDKIAEKMTFADYETARTFSLLKSTPGEAGGVFRDPKQSKDLRKQLKEAEAWAESQCFVK
jgi:PBP1b-binding outer membrane lipoprotein LpoB